MTRKISSGNPIVISSYRVISMTILGHVFWENMLKNSALKYFMKEDKSLSSSSSSSNIIYIYIQSNKRTDASFGREALSSAGGSMLRLEGLLEPSGGEARCRGASASCACRTQTRS